MKDGEIGVVHADGRTLDLSRVQKAPNQKVELSPAPWPHWTIKETFEQPEAISRALGFGGRLTSDRVKLGGLDSNEEKVSWGGGVGGGIGGGQCRTLDLTHTPPPLSSQLMSIKNMTLSACGTSLNAAMYERAPKTCCCFLCRPVEDRAAAHPIALNPASPFAH